MGYTLQYEICTETNKGAVMTHIKTITSEQKKHLDIIAAEWIDIGLSTEPSNLAKAEGYIKMAYRAVNLKAPDKFEFFPSPFAVKDYLGSDYTKSYPVYGPHEAGWLSFYDAMGYLGVNVSILEGLIGAAKNCGWWFPYEDQVLVSDRPSEIHMLDGECHNDDGMAIKYRDSRGVWCISGIRVDEQIILHPSTQTIEQIHAESNEEVRRIRIERFGILRYINESGAIKIDSNDNYVENTYEILVQTKFGLRLLTHCPSTGRMYFMAVPDGAKTCAESQKSIWGGHSINLIGRT